MSDDRSFRTWNVFCRCDDGGLCCAVPADDPVPAFLLSGGWNFGFAHTEGDPPMAGFSAPAAAGGVALSGFYLFIAFQAPHRALEPNGGFAHCSRSGRQRGAEAEEERCPSTPTA